MIQIPTKTEKEDKICVDCESKFRLMYRLDETSGYPKFCPFCGDTLSEDTQEEVEFEE